MNSKIQSKTRFKSIIDYNNNLDHIDLNIDSPNNPFFSKNSSKLVINNKRCNYLNASLITKCAKQNSTLRRLPVVQPNIANLASKCTIGQPSCNPVNHLLKYNIHKRLPSFQKVRIPNNNKNKNIGIELLSYQHTVRIPDSFELSVLQDETTVRKQRDPLDISKIESKTINSEVEMDSKIKTEHLSDNAFDAIPFKSTNQSDIEAKP